MELPQPQARDPLTHPVEVIQRGHAKAAEAQELHRLATTVSIGYALATTIERKQLSGIGRQFGLPSSGVLLEQFNNTQCRMDFEDWLPMPAPTMPRTRALVEQQYYGEELMTKPINH